MLVWATQGVLHRGQERTHCPTGIGSHVPMLPNPRLVIEVIRAAANAVTDMQASKRG